MFPMLIIWRIVHFVRFCEKLTSPPRHCRVWCHVHLRMHRLCVLWIRMFWLCISLGRNRNHDQTMCEYLPCASPTYWQLCLKCHVVRIPLCINWRSPPCKYGNGNYYSRDHSEDTRCGKVLRSALSLKKKLKVNVTYSVATYDAAQSSLSSKSSTIPVFTSIAAASSSISSSSSIIITAPVLASGSLSWLANAS